MVGIAGKSKACHDCRRRRVKCDLTLPLCLRCAKAGIACRGYKQSTLWVHRTPACPNVTASSVITDLRLQEPTPEISVPSVWPDLIQRMYTRLSPNGLLYDIPMFRLEALRIAQSIYFPRSPGIANSNDISLLPSSWLTVICEMQRPNDALDYSLLAFCAIQVRLSGETSLSYHETVRLYNHALSKIITILDSSCVTNSDEVLAAIVILSTCEVFLLHASTSWNAHAQGISEILCRRRIPKTTSLNWTNLCRRLCIICVIQALFQRHSLILEPIIWRQHIGLPVALGSFSEFLDIIIDIPSVLAGAHALILHNETDLKQSLQYVSLLHQKFRDLDHWRELHHRSTTAYIQGSLYWSVLSRANNPTDDGYVDKLFPFALMFSSVESACAWVLCSTIMLDVLYTISLLGLPSVSNDKTLPSLTNIIEDKIPEYNASNISSIGLTDADRLARMLCQSIEFCYRRENGTFGPQMTSYTQSVLLRYFSRRGLNRELEWCIAIKDMRGPGTNFDVDVRQFRSAPM